VAKLSIEFNLDNAIYEGYDDEADWAMIAETVESVAKKVYEGNREGQIIDPTGNSVGYFKIEEDN